MATKSVTREEIDMIEQEHEALREKLGQISRVLEVGEMPRKDLLALLGELEDDLTVHFSHEEHQGVFDQITAQAPRLTRQVDGLWSEHRDMLKEIGTVIESAESGKMTRPWWKELGVQFRALSKQLMHHESAENQLLQRAFQEDIGAND